MERKKDLILIIEDNDGICQLLSEALEDEGYETATANDANTGLNKFRDRHPEVVLLDMQLPGTDGFKVLESIKKLDKDSLVIMLTAYQDARDVVRAMRLGAYDCISKPFNRTELKIVIQNALHTRHLTKEVEALKQKLECCHSEHEVKGDSPKFCHALKQVRIISPTNLTVILQGESGTGKELIARMIHSISQRKAKPFIAIDCGTLPDTLAESELFGHEKGAFTGADCSKEGQFEMAKGGTLFLDEITNLSDSVQAKLLRVIQERKIHRLGGKREIAIDVRVIVATNLDFAAEVKAGNFRADLYHRLNEFSIEIPPLRERQEDIIPLALHFLEDANMEFKKEIKGISNEAVRALMNYNWPGNVREMRNVIRKAVILTDSGKIMPSVLSALKVENRPVNECRSTADNGKSFKELRCKMTRELEKQIVQQALEEAKNNKSKAARILKIDRVTLYSKMKALGL
ncbi:MAG: sigma-54-dependent Fis family transcriptional regulator [Deltaproteobacteria bacterium]|nr:sigma-54-dependent Fis family transcriptional regulator [Deltaproteobacteria bacterium]